MFDPLPAQCLPHPFGNSRFFPLPTQFYIMVFVLSRFFFLFDFKLYHKHLDSVFTFFVYKKREKFLLFFPLSLSQIHLSPSLSPSPLRALVWGPPPLPFFLVFWFFGPPVCSSWLPHSPRFGASCFLCHSRAKRQKGRCTVIALLGVAVLITYSPQNGVILLVMAFLISPMGLPLAAIWLLGKVQSLKFAIQDWVYG